MYESTGSARDTLARSAAAGGTCAAAICLLRVVHLLNGLAQLAAAAAGPTCTPR